MNQQEKEMILHSIDRIRFGLILRDSVKIISTECKFIEDVLESSEGKE